jgi:hypothetical protein
VETGLRFKAAGPLYIDFVATAAGRSSFVTSRTICACAMLVSLVGAASGAKGADAIQIISPSDDVICRSPMVTVSGTATGSVVALLVDGQPICAVSVLAGRWTSTMQTAMGTHEVKATCGASSNAILLTLPPETLAARSQQKVRFEWLPSAEQMLAAIAADTLEPPPNKSDVAMMIDTVKNRVPTMFMEHYKGIGNIVLVDTAGDDVHTVEMNGKCDENFGVTDFDCGNTIAKQRSSIHVGTYYASMTEDVDSWLPMRTHDSWRVRAEDLARCLGRTSAHEVGHGLGLVGGRTTCTWMSGTTDFHNNANFGRTFGRRGTRYKHGWYIMDAGAGFTDNAARLGEDQAPARASKRRPSIFNSFSSSYLRIVQP